MSSPSNFPHGFYVPNHLLPFPQSFETREINISSLYVGVKTAKNLIKYVGIRESIIFRFLHDKIIKGLTDSPNIRSYRRYIQENAVTQEPELLSLVSSIKDNGIRRKYPPLVFRSAKRILPFGRYDVADGHNRLSVMAVIGYQTVRVVYFKRPILTKLMKKSHAG